MNVRYIAAAAVLYFALTGGKLPSIGPAGTPSGPYTGPLTALHDAAGQMDPKDRSGLSEALDAASKMIAEDKAGLLTTTEALQKAARGSIAFGYSTFSVKKYGNVASLIQAELEKAIGTEVVAVTPEVRGKVAASLADASRAVR